MKPLWLLRADHEAPGWKKLEEDAREEKVDWVLYDRDAWVLLRADEPPTDYEGFVASEPRDGLYVDHQGRPVYVVDRKVVPTAKEVLAALDDQDKVAELMDKYNDADVTLERMGRAY
jgi:hypothetical protein